MLHFSHFCLYIIDISHYCLVIIALVIVIIAYLVFIGKNYSYITQIMKQRCNIFKYFNRAEGCGVVILKRFADAIRDGDNIRAVIRGSALNNDGAGTSFGTPNAKAQQRVFRAALNRAGVAPSEVSFLEAHGTGTVVGKRNTRKLNSFWLNY